MGHGMTETDAKGTKTAGADRKVAWDWGVFFRLIYLVVVLAVTLPVIFFALAAYQYQVDAKAIATEKGLDAQDLMWRAAYINRSLHALSADSQAASQAPVPVHTPENETPERQAAGVANAQESTQAGQSDEGAGAPAASQAAAAANNPDAADSADSAGSSPTAACVQALAPLCAGARPGPNPGADPVALVLAAELQRFDALALHTSLPLYGRPSVLAELPGWTLTLMVTLVAGLLGSLIYVLKVTLRQRLDTWSMGPKAPTEPRPWSWLLLRPVFGVVIALGAYVALQSGILVFDGAMDLEPSAYVTAAVGLIAGLLSWHMIETIERLGQQWLSSNRPQWAYGLDRYIEERGKKVPDLAKELDVSKELLDDWIKQRIPVPKETTTRLAAALKVHPELLFQPVPPWRRNQAIGQN